MDGGGCPNFTRNWNVAVKNAKEKKKKVGRRSMLPSFDLHSAVLHPITDTLDARGVLGTQTTII